MKCLNKEEFEKYLEFVRNTEFTVEIQQKLYEFMYEQTIIGYHLVSVPMKDLKIMTKMCAILNNPERSPNWCASLSDGTQIVWNRKSQTFFHIP